MNLNNIKIRIHERQFKEIVEEIDYMKDKFIDN
jgi:hypothetical protein